MRCVFDTIWLAGGIPSVDEFVRVMVANSNFNLFVLLFCLETLVFFDRANRAVLYRVGSGGIRNMIQENNGVTVHTVSLSTFRLVVHP